MRLSQFRFATYPSYSHPIFHMQDIMDEIFQWIPQTSLPRLACVNKLWFRSAVPIIWKDVKLLNALSPLGTRTKVDYRDHLLVDPTPQRWSRFMLYAQYVRKVSATEWDTPILQTIIKSPRPAVRYLFPHANSLQWTLNSMAFARLEASLISLMMPPSLRNLSLTTELLHVSALSGFCSAIVASRVALEHLDLDIFSIDPLPEGLLLFKQFILFVSRTLKGLKIPPTMGTRAILDILYQCSSLSTLSISQFPDVPYASHFPRIRTRHGAIQQRGFDYLQHLSFHGPQELLFTAVFARCALSHLKQLKLKFHYQGDTPDIVIRTIAGSCPQLQELDFSLDTKNGSFPNHSNLLSVPYSSIRPLLGCSNLVSLLLRSFAVSMDDAQLIELLSSRRSWESIAIYTEAPLEFNHLLIFAECCPHLTSLSLFVDGSLGPESIPHVPLRKSFPALSEIDFQHSIAGGRNSSKIARFLSKICNQPPTILGTDTRYWDALSLRMAAFYFHDCRSANKPVPQSIKLYISHVVSVYLDMREADEAMGYDNMDYEDTGYGRDFNVDMNQDELDFIVEGLTMWLRAYPDSSAFRENRSWTLT